jgi:hypothetical protein
MVLICFNSLKVYILPKRARCPYCDRLFNRALLDKHVLHCRARTQRKAAQTADYQRRNVIVDGTNVAYYLATAGVPRVANLVRAHHSLVNAGLKPVIVVSSALKYRIDKEQQLRALIDDRFVIEAPRGTDDDLTIIRLADRQNADIISNDRFLNWIKRYPWISSRLRKYRMTPSGLILN